MIAIVLQVALGGALGAVCRYLSVYTVQQAFGASFPFGTLVVNVVGSFLIGILFGVISTNGSGIERFMPFVITGFLGSYTTFSAYSLDLWGLISTGKVDQAILYALLSTIIAFGLLFIGILIGRSIG